MDKNKLLLFPLCIGVMLIIYSWSSNYPLSIDSPADFLFNHISPVYWWGLALTLASLYIIATTLKSDILKWIITTGIVMSMYSLSYFYYQIPGSDSHYFRGLTEYSLTTENLDPSEPYHSYFQWPLFFILSKTAYALGLNARYFEFVLFAVIGVLYVTSLYCIYRKSSKDGAYLAVVSFFITMTYYLNYQFAPFSLCIGLLFVLFMLQSYDVKKREVTLITLIIFTSMTLLHSFLPAFFILYILVKYAITRDRMYIKLFLVTLAIYFVVLMYQARIFFQMALQDLLRLGSAEYGKFAEGLFVGAVTPVDALAQTFSRTAVIVTAIASGFGFVILLLRRELRRNDYAILLSGIIYVVMGAIMPILGVRAFALIGIPVSLGATYFLKGRFRIYYQCLLLILITSFTFVPLHSSYVSTRSQIMFQTKEDYQCANFLIDHYNWNKTSLVLSDIRSTHYLATKSYSYNVSFDNDFSVYFPRDIKEYDCIMLTVGLQKSFLRYNSTESIFDKINEKNRAYDSGFSHIFIEPDLQRVP